MILTQATGIIMGPITWLLGTVFNAIYNLFFGMGVESIALSIVVFTIFVRLILFPFNLKTSKSSKIQQYLRPEFNKISKKYKGKRDQQSMLAQQRETRELQEKYGIKMSQGCLTALIQLPVFIGLYNVIQNVPAYVNRVYQLFKPIAVAIQPIKGSSSVIAQFATAEKLRLTTKAVNYASATDAAGIKQGINYIIDVLYKCNADQLGRIGEKFASHPEVAQEIANRQDSISHVNHFLFGINLSEAPGLKISAALIIPIVAFLCQFLAMKVTPMNETGDPQQDAQMRTMRKTMYIMPVFSFFITAISPAGLGIYWATSAFVSFLITVFTNMYYDHADMEKIIEKQQEKAAKKIAKRKAKGKVSLTERLYGAGGEGDSGDGSPGVSTNKGLNKYGNMNLKNYESEATQSKPKKGSLADKANAVKRFNDTGVDN